MAVRLIKHQEIGNIKLVKRKGAKSLRISITRAGEVRVTMPRYLSYKLALAYVDSKKSWILKHTPKRTELTHGMKFAGNVELRFQAQDNLRSIRAVRQPSSKLLVIKHPGGQKTHDLKIQEKAASYLHKELILESKSRLSARTEQIARRTEYDYGLVRIKRMRGRWGSCDASGNITLNCFLLQLPQELIDYVIIHELVHTKRPNHGPDFWEAVAQHLPDYKKLKRELSTHSPVLQPLITAAA